MKKTITVVLLIIALLCSALPAGALAASDNAASSRLDEVYNAAGQKLLSDAESILTGSIGGEWLIFGLARAGIEIPDNVREQYIAQVKDYVDNNYNSENNRLHKSKSTEHSRLIIALTALGIDASDFYGYDLTAALRDVNYDAKQGTNGITFALISLDAAGLNDDATRAALIDKALEKQNADGSWMSTMLDYTTMMIQALAPYYNSDERVKDSVDRALAYTFSMQQDNGGFGENSDPESAVQVVVALTALGRNPTDEQYCKNGKSAVDAILDYYVGEGSFKHSASATEANQMATEQAYYGLTAYYRFINGQTSLYDMADVRADKQAPAGTPFTDVPSSAYYAAAVEWAYNNKITTGTTDTTFGSADTCTRGQVVTFLWRAMGKPEPTSTVNNFTDVKEGDYYYKAVLWAVENEITDGTGTATFSPKQTCSYAHIITFIWRAMGKPGNTGKGSWYDDAYNWASGRGLTADTAASEIKGNCPRSDVVTFLYRALSK